MKAERIQASQLQQGFSLIELIMVMVIIGALSVVAMAKFNPDSFEAAAVSGELISAMRYAQEKSMSNTGATDYQITLTGGGYSVTQGGAAIPHPVTGVAGYTSAWSGVTLSPTGTISFDGYGTPSLGGALAFSANQEVISVSVGAESRNVTIEQLTGFVR